MKTSIPKIAFDAVVLDCKDIYSLSSFYIKLLCWKKNYEEPDEWIDIISPDGNIKIAFQRNDNYIPPVWPEQAGKQQQIAHLDFKVESQEQLTAAVSHATSCGAVKAPIQFGEEDGRSTWVTFFDLEGHPFCFVIWE